MHTKLVTRRSGPREPLRDARVLQRTMRRLRGDAIIPKRICRFATHEEADVWMTRQIAATHARRKSRTSPSG